MFARIVNPENFSSLSDKSVPINQRMPPAMTFLSNAKAWMSLYFGASSSRRFFGDELLELQAYLLSVVQGLADEFLTTLDPQDPSYETRRAGLSKWKKGVGTMLLGVIVTLSEVSQYGEGALIRFAGKLQSTAPSLRAGLPSDIGSKVDRRLDRLLFAPMSEKRRKSLGDLSAAIRHRASE